jgi:hypothetical protein
MRHPREAIHRRVETMTEFRVLLDDIELSSGQTSEISDAIRRAVLPLLAELDIAQTVEGASIQDPQGGGVGPHGEEWKGLVVKRGGKVP